MIRTLQIGASLAMLAAVSACSITPDPGVGPNGELPVIAKASDGGIDAKPGLRSATAIAYDPDGCQTWLIDDGFEGYATRRNDPVSGLPVCNNLYPGGTVVGEYRVNGIPNWIPR